LGSQSTKAYRHAETLQELLGVCLHESGVELSPSSAITQTFWRDAELIVGVSIHGDIIKEILYKLFSLNFGYELLVLHSHAQSADLYHQDALVACFPEWSMLVVELVQGNIGLSAERLEDRLPYLLAIKRLMSTWAGPIPEAIQAQDKSGDCFLVVEIEDLEHQVASFYTQSFFSYFGCAAIVPHRLT